MASIYTDLGAHTQSGIDYSTIARWRRSLHRHGSISRPNTNAVLREWWTRLSLWRGGGSPIQLPGHCVAGPLLKSGIPAWASPLLPQLSSAAELFIINLVAHHDPQPNAQFARRCDPGLAHSFLDELAPVEAFQFRVFPYRMHHRFGP